MNARREAAGHEGRLRGLESAGDSEAPLVVRWREEAPARRQWRLVGRGRASGVI